MERNPVLMLFFCGKNAQGTMAKMYHVWRNVHGGRNGWNICQNREKCEKNRRKALTNIEFRDYNEDVCNRETRANNSPCYRDNNPTTKK